MSRGLDVAAVTPVLVGLLVALCVVLAAVVFVDDEDMPW